jgi:hypothetical protein
MNVVESCLKGAEKKKVRHVSAYEFDSRPKEGNIEDTIEKLEEEKTREHENRWTNTQQAGERLLEKLDRMALKPESFYELGFKLELVKAGWQMAYMLVNLSSDNPMVDVKGPNDERKKEFYERIDSTITLIDKCIEKTNAKFVEAFDYVVDEVKNKDLGSCTKALVDQEINEGNKYDALNSVVEYEILLEGHIDAYKKLKKNFSQEDIATMKSYVKEVAAYVRSNVYDDWQKAYGIDTPAKNEPAAKAEGDWLNAYN